MRELKGDWRDLFNGFMLGLDLRKMFLGFTGLLLTFMTVGGVAFLCANWLRPGSVELPECVLSSETTDAAGQAVRTIVRDVTALRVPRLSGAALHGGGAAPNDFVHTLKRSLNVIFNCCDPTLRGVSRVKRALSGLLVAFIFLGIWSFFGGAIARIAAVEVARDERIETQKALHFAHEKYWSFFWAPVVCAAGYLFFALCNVMGGGVGQIIDWISLGTLGDLVVAVLLPLALLSGFIMTLILIGTLFGLPLFAPAIAVEGTDSFDAISRGFSYVYSRPWHYAFYQLVSAAYGVVCVTFVWIFGSVMIKLALRSGTMCFADMRDVVDYLFGSTMVSAGQLQIHQVFAAWVVGFWLLITGGLLAGYSVSYFFGSQTLIYCLLRKKVDGIEMNEVYEEQEPEEGEAPAGPDAGGSPKTDAPASGKPDEKTGS